MNVQIFGTKKSFDTKKAQRYFKERRIKVQFIDLKEKEMSKGELTSVMQAVGGIDKLLNPKAKDEETLALIQHLTSSQRFDKLLENQQSCRAHRAQRQKGHRGLPARDLENVGINRAFTKNPRPGFCTGGQFVVY